MINRVDLLRLPFRSIEEVLGLQNGTTLLHEKQHDETSSPGPWLSIRGNQPTETGYYVNGVQMNDPYSGYFTTRISPLAIERMTLNPAAFGAQHGFSGASAVGITTRRGGPGYSGTLEAITDNTIGSDFDQNWYTATLGGPIPAVRNGRFFGCIERRYFGDRNPSSKTDDFLPGSPNRLPGNWLDGWSYNTRLDYELRRNMSITATLDGLVTEWSQYIHAYYFDWKHLPYYKDENLALSGGLKHQLTPTLNYSVQVSYLKWEHFEGDGVYKEDLDSYVRPYANPELDPYLLFFDWDDLYSITPGFDESSYWDYYLRYKSTQSSARFELSKEIEDNFKLTLGAEYRRYTIRAYENLVPTNVAGYYVRNVNHYGYDIDGNEADDGGTAWGNEVKHPKEYGANLAEQLRFGDLEVNPGLRLDIFDYNSVTIRNRYNPFGIDGRLGPEDMEAVPKYVRWSPRINFSFTPEGFALALEGGYGLYYVPAPYSTVYSGWDFTEARIGAGSYYPHANSGMEPSKIKSFQLGATCSAGDLLRMKITGFHNETENVLTIIHVTPAYPYVYDQYGTNGKWRSFGLETNIQFSLQNHLVFKVSHTIQKVKSNSEHGHSAYNIAWKNPFGISRRPMYTAGLDVPHTFSGELEVMTSEGEGPSIAGVHPLERLTLTVTQESVSGLPYTPTMPYDAVAHKLVQQTPTGPINSARSRNAAFVHVMLQREIPVAGMTITPFLWVINLFDVEVVNYVYSGTGQPDNTGYLQTAEGIYRVENDYGPVDRTGMNFEEKYNLAQRDPVNYGSPRQVFFGLRVNF